MRKIVVLLIAVSGILSACVANQILPQRDYNEQQGNHSNYRGTTGNFCPPRLALKGYC